MKEMEEWKFFNIKVWIFLLLISFLLIYREAFSKVSGACSDCHTMHYSQSGGIIVGEWKSGGPFKALLIGDCVFCHTGTNDGTNITPYVYSTNSTSYNFGGERNTLAGGNFYWVTLNNNYGHNVEGIPNVTTPDPNFLSATSYPPGYDSTYRGGITWPENQPVTCAGTYGCHGDPSKEDPVEAILGAHHQNVLCNSTTNNCDGSTVAKSYRFLLGIKGTEDPDWELTLSKDDHNGYYAVDESPTPGSNSGSINYLCAECHGQFHNGTYSSNYQSPWLRHPTDYDMNNVKSKEYGNYPNISVFSGKLGVSATGDYFTDVPVGNTQGAVLSKVLQSNGDAIVLCISCHRAHATPYDDILRWNYRGWPGIPDNQNGCLACHTTKY